MPRERDLRIGFAVVRGESMLPTLREGQVLLVNYRANPKPGQLVVVCFADGTVAVKRATEPRLLYDGSDGWWVLSDNPDRGVDSRHRGPVGLDQVLGVVRWRVWPRPRRLS